MRLVTREEFLKLPNDIIFMKIGRLGRCWNLAIKRSDSQHVLVESKKGAQDGSDFYHSYVKGLIDEGKPLTYWYYSWVGGTFDGERNPGGKLYPPQPGIDADKDHEKEDTFYVLEKEDLKTMADVIKRAYVALELDI